MKEKIKSGKVCIVGLGYVGLPLAETFSNHLKTIGFDIDQEKVKRLSESKNEDNIEFTSDPSKINRADFVLIAVPTPVTKFKEPDLSFVKSAAKTVGKNLNVIMDCVIVAVAHDEFKNKSFLSTGPFFQTLKSLINKLLEKV